MKRIVSSPGVVRFFRQSAFALAIAVVSGGAVFLVQRGRADSLPGITAFQAADMGSRAVLEEMKRIGKGAISRLSGGCSNGSIKGKNSSGTYQVTFHDIADQPMDCSENLEDVAAIETTGFFAPEKRIVRAVLAQATSTGSNDYVTTGAESQVKKGALGIGGLFKAYSGINTNNQRITNVAAPTEASDAATKAYVDAAGGSGSGSCSGGVTGGYRQTSSSGGYDCTTWGAGATMGGEKGACDWTPGYTCTMVSEMRNVSGASSAYSEYFLCFKS